MIGNMYEIIQQRNNYKRECSVYKLGLNNHANEPYKEITHEMFNKLIQQRDQYKAENEKLKEELLNKNRIISKRLEESEILSENEKLKEEVEHLKGIIQDEEDWKLIEFEERWE